MKTLQIIELIKGLPLSEKLQILELIFKEIKEEAGKTDLAEEKRIKAAKKLLADYKKDESLTAFTVLDTEDSALARV